MKFFNIFGQSDIQHKKNKKMSGINVLSLFNGMGCAWLALDRAGIKVNRRLSSEINKFSNKVNDANYPDTEQLGSVVDIDVNKLPTIQLLVGGSPCQNLSFSGKRKGFSTKCQIAQNRIRNYWVNFGMAPAGFFGDLESIIEQPKDRKIFLKHILQPEIEVDKKYYLSEKMISYLNTRSGKYSDVKIESEKTGTLNTKNNSPQLSTDSGTTLIRVKNPKANFNGGKINFKSSEDKASCITSSSSSLDISDNIIVCQNIELEITAHCGQRRQSKNGNGVDGKSYCLDKSNPTAIEITSTIVAMRGRGEGWKQTLEYNNSGKSNSLTTVQKDNLLEIKKVVQLNQSKESGDQQPYQQNRIYDINGLSPALSTLWNGGPIVNTPILRRLTPIEQERLQGVPDNYTNHVSDTQRCKMLGNGWNIETIAHLLNYLKKEIESI